MLRSGFVKPRRSQPSAEHATLPRAPRRPSPAIAPSVPPVDDDARTMMAHTGFEDDSSTVMRKPLPTLPPDASGDFGATPGSSNPQPAKEAFYPAPGKTLAGKYELRAKVAQGTFGLVFTARDTNLDRDVAIKILNPAHMANSDILHRFLQEARAAARIAHPGIVTMFECGTFDTGAFIAMELLQGEALMQRIASVGRMAPEVAIEVARQVASALDAAHRVHVLHRDLKPDNIYLVADPAMASGERVKVLDFGLAKLGTSGMTQMNTVFGTPRYMSPEQCRSSTQIDHRSDIYALGCILFEMVTGRPPYDGTLRDLVERHQRAPIPRAKQFAPDIDQALEDLISQMLQKDPASRLQTMAAVQRALEKVKVPTGADALMPSAARLMGFADTAPRDAIATAPPPRETPRRWSGMRRASIIAATIAFVLAGALTAVAVRNSGDEPAVAKRVQP